jgi:hypothetical protein
MRYKFTSPTYADYPDVNAMIFTCVQNTSSADPSTYEAVGMCHAILLCVLDNTDNEMMATFGAGTTILGFV